MAKFDEYNIPLKGLKAENQVLEFDLDDQYFKKIDSPEVQHGNVKAKVTVTKKTNLFELSFNLAGLIQIPCDRCLDEMNQPIQYKEKLQVKFGDSFSEEGDIVIVPETDGGINIAWFLYEFIVLNIPIKHVHAPGECNKTMVSKLKKHITRRKNDDDDNVEDVDLDDDDDLSVEEPATDPRWDGLQNIFENN
ncbi:MAG: YceD family protein [Paludibacter sp.]